MADVPTPPDELIFGDPEEVAAAAEAAQGFAIRIMTSRRGEIANDAETRDHLYDGVEALHYVLGQLKKPSTLEQLLLRDLAQLADQYAAERSRQSREIADGIRRSAT